MSLEDITVTFPWEKAKIPEYRNAYSTNWRLRRTPALNRAVGYWTISDVAPGFLLQKKAKGKKFVNWMSLTPMETESHEPHIAMARGGTIVAGLGMGLYLYNIIQKPEVRAVLVIEKDEEVIKLFHRIAQPERWPGWEKVTIRHEDIFKARNSGTSVDHLYVDIWPTLGASNALAETTFIAQNLQPQTVSYWGQELDFAMWLVTNKLDTQKPTLDAWNAFALSAGLRLGGAEIGEMYPRFAVAAACFQHLSGAKNDYEKGALVATALRLIGALNVDAALSDEAVDKESQLG